MNYSIMIHFENTEFMVESRTIISINTEIVTICINFEKIKGMEFNYC